MPHYWLCCGAALFCSQTAQISCGNNHLKSTTENIKNGTWVNNVKRKTERNMPKYAKLSHLRPRIPVSRYNRVRKRTQGSQISGNLGQDGSIFFFFPVRWWTFFELRLLNTGWICVKQRSISAALPHKLNDAFANHFILHGPCKTPWLCLTMSSTPKIGFLAMILISRSLKLVGVIGWRPQGERFHHHRCSSKQLPITSLIRQISRGPFIILICFPHSILTRIKH